MDKLSNFSQEDATDVCEMSHSILGLTKEKTTASWQLVEASKEMGDINHPNGIPMNTTFAENIPVTAPTFIITIAL